MHQDRVAALEAAVGHQRAPRRHTGAGERSRFSGAPPLRRQGEGRGRRHHEFARIAVRAVARHTGEPALRRIAIQPVREKGRDHEVADGEALDPLPHRQDLTRAIGHRDPAVRGGDCADHYEIVVVVQRTGPDPDRDVPWPGRLRIRQVHPTQGLEAGRLRRLDRFHERLASLFKRDRRDASAAQAFVA